LIVCSKPIERDRERGQQNDEKQILLGRLTQKERQWGWGNL